MWMLRWLIIIIKKRAQIVCRSMIKNTWCNIVFLSYFSLPLCVYGVYPHQAAVGPDWVLIPVSFFSFFLSVHCSLHCPLLVQQLLFPNKHSESSQACLKDFITTNFIITAHPPFPAEEEERWWKGRAAVGSTFFFFFLKEQDSKQRPPPKKSPKTPISEWVYSVPLQIEYSRITLRVA